MYVHRGSGHYQAALALARTFQTENPGTQCRLVDTLDYSNAILARLIQRTYLRMIKRSPEIWEYLYDNPKVLRNIQGLRKIIHKYHSRKFKRLLESFKPSAIVCTQAFPCGIVSDYKSTYLYRTPLYAVLTDYLPHSYWVSESVDKYFVANHESLEKLRQVGIPQSKLLVTGIPIDGRYSASGHKNINPKSVLIMGGNQGIGPIEKLVHVIDRSKQVFDIEVVAGRNKVLYKKLEKLQEQCRHRMTVHAYVNHMAELMKKAAILVTKPGGLTIAQSLVCRLPMIFIKPIPGQEAKNADYLLKHKAALEAFAENEVPALIERLLNDKEKIISMKKIMQSLAKPEASKKIVHFIIHDLNRSHD